MEISNEEAITCVCELMRVFLLQKFFSMMDCPALQSCEQYLESLPASGQEHVQACLRIEELLAADESLEEEARAYFTASCEEEVEEDEDY